MDWLEKIQKNSIKNWQKYFIFWIALFVVSISFYLISAIWQVSSPGFDPTAQALAWTGTIIFLISTIFAILWVVGFQNYKKNLVVKTLPLKFLDEKVDQKALQILTEEKIKKIKKEKIALPEKGIKKIAKEPSKKEIFKLQFNEECRILNGVDALKNGISIDKIVELQNQCLDSIKKEL